MRTQANLTTLHIVFISNVARHVAPPSESNVNRTVIQHKLQLIGMRRRVIISKIYFSTTLFKFKTDGH